MCGHVLCGGCAAEMHREKNRACPVCREAESHERLPTSAFPFDMQRLQVRPRPAADQRDNFCAQAVGSLPSSTARYGRNGQPGSSMFCEFFQTAHWVPFSNKADAEILKTMAGAHAARRVRITRAISGSALCWTWFRALTFASEMALAFRHATIGTLLPVFFDMLVCYVVYLSLLDEMSKIDTAEPGGEERGHAFVDRVINSLVSLAPEGWMQYLLKVVLAVAAMNAVPRSFPVLRDAYLSGFLEDGTEVPRIDHVESEWMLRERRFFLTRMRASSPWREQGLSLLGWSFLTRCAPYTRAYLLARSARGGQTALHRMGTGNINRKTMTMTTRVRPRSGGIRSQQRSFARAAAPNPNIKVKRRTKVKSMSVWRAQ
eukprot:g679.t1